jgi:sugar O-acyltransferase (sialic acid O-acetyltransferase NeuD family)
MSKTKLIIVGDSSFAEVACELFDALGTYDVVAFSVHSAFKKSDELLGRPIYALEQISDFCSPAECEAFVALTYRELNRARTRLCVEMKGRGYKLATYISPHAFVWRNVSVGENCFIFENNVIQPFCKIGNNVVLWSGNHIGHHSTVEDNVFVASHVVVSGHVTIGRNSFLGVNATVADTVKVGADNWIGPNALVTKDTTPNSLFRVEATERSAVDALRFFRVKE